MALQGLPDLNQLFAPVTAGQGGTGLTSYTIGDLIYASGTTTLSKLADIATGNALLSGGVGVAPAWGKIGLTTHVSGTLPVANGGTNLSSYTAGDLPYASGATAISALGIGAANTVLTSSGSAPQWSTSLTLAGKITLGNIAGISVTASGVIDATDAFRVNAASNPYYLFQIGGVTSAFMMSTAANTIQFRDSGSTPMLEMAAGALTLTAGTKTSDVKAISSTVTWNAGGVSFTGWKLNVTNTASAAGSLLLDLQTGGTSQFKVSKDSVMTMAGVAYAGAANGELWHDTTQKAFKYYANGIQRCQVGVIYSAAGGGATGPSSSTSETSVIHTTNSFGSLTLPANFLAAGRMIRITVSGSVSNLGSTPTLQVKLKIGSTTLWDSTAITMAALNGGVFRMILFVYCNTAGGSGSSSVKGTAHLDMVASDADNTLRAFDWSHLNSTAIDTAVSNAIDITAQFGTAGSNIFGSLMTLIEALN